MYTPSLKEFLDPVPVCTETASLAMVLTLLRQTEGDRAVMLNDEQHPLGLISLKKLMLYLAEANGLSGSAPIVSIRSKLQHSLRKLAIETGQPLLDPLATLPEYWTLSQFYPHLREVEQGHWALVDRAGRFVGLLNRLRLLRFLATQPDLNQVTSHYSMPETPARLADLERTSETADVAVTQLDALVDLLERLPLPIMLQTNAGRVIAQNAAWRQQVGELQDPARIRYDAAQLLETIAPSGVDSDRPLAIDSDRDLAQLMSWPLAQSAPAVVSPLNVSTVGLCQSGATPDSCVCTCPMKDGQERVWQLVKIPLGAVAPLRYSVRQHAVPLDAPGDRSTSTARFHLAALGLNVDPAWTSVAQTESLWLVVAQDTTEQQQVAKELAAKNADLVQLNRLKDEFLACISHELKTPLTAILGLSSLLKDQALGALNDRQKRYAELIHQSGRHLVLIVNDILDLTRIETGQLELTPEPVQIDLVCQRAYQQARQLQPVAAEAQIQKESWQAISFTLDIQPGLDTLIADEMRLRQMLVNLLSNALKFTQPGGKIGLTVEVWEGWLAFTVWDTGIGIPADKQHLIFQKFQQLENPMTRQFEGTGLGLVLTQRLARLHGGDVTFTSVEGEGSQFTLLLPSCPPASVAGLGVQPAHSAPRATATASNRLAIVVESVPRFWQELTRQLTGLGYRVAIARSGTEAIEKIRRLQPRVVFLNPLLPLLSGWDVLTLLKTDDETRHIPVIVTATQVEKIQASRNHANGFLSLPIQTEALQHSLEQLEAESAMAQPLDALLNLTVLHLRVINPEVLSEPNTATLISDLNGLLSPYRCRVLEVDDLDQADLLARVWKPDLVLLDGFIAEPLLYLRKLSQYPFLSAIPLVTLTAETTQAANQVAGLLVFPCLARTSTPPDSTVTQPEPSALLQVMQVAAGMSWAPHILIIEAGLIQSDWVVSMPDGSAPLPNNSPKTAEWLQACAQYMQVAGLHSSIGYSWSEVLQQLQHQSIDLLLICLGQSAPHPSALSALQPLEHLPSKPPILLWQQHPQGEEGYDSITHLLLRKLGAIATCILPSSTSMKEVVDEISRMLGG